MREKRIEIGTFRELNGNDYYPEVESLKLPAEKKETVLSYLRNAPHIAESPGMAVDAFTKERLHTPISLQGDDIYIWRSDIAYYFEKYDLKLPDDFIEYIRQQKSAKQADLKRGLLFCYPKKHKTTCGGMAVAAGGCAVSAVRQKERFRCPWLRGGSAAPGTAVVFGAARSGTEIEIFHEFFHGGGYGLSVFHTEGDGPRRRHIQLLRDDAVRIAL